MDIVLLFDTCKTKHDFEYNICDLYSIENHIYHQEEITDDKIIKYFNCLFNSIEIGLKIVVQEDKIIIHVEKVEKYESIKNKLESEFKLIIVQKDIKMINFVEFRESKYE